jgi:hypothetical protein
VVCIGARALIVLQGLLGLYPTPFRRPASPVIRPDHNFHRWLTGAQPSLTALASLRAMENLFDMENYVFWRFTSICIVNKFRSDSKYFTKILKWSDIIG